MEFEFKGGNCVVITAKHGTIVIDGKLSTIGLKDVQPKDAIELATQVGFAGADGRVTVDMPGEYEISDISIHGVAAARMIDYDGSLQATMYRIAFPELSIAVLGHVATPLTDDQLESLGVVDVLIVPVGGGGYTLDAHHAVEIVHKINPKVIIPTHYADSHSHYEVPQDALEPFVKELGAAVEVSTKWKIKNGLLPETQTVIELTRTS
jgi:L-ascorbate metabolism protein UlaG (beta-lactamase superfamily)